MYGEETAERQNSEKKNENWSTMKTQTDSLKSNGVDVMPGVSRTRVWDLPRTGIHSGGRLIEMLGRKADRWTIGYLRERMSARVASGRRALFTSDGTYSGSSESDASEGHVDRPPEGQNGTDRRTNERKVEGGVEELGFPHKSLERTVTQLQKELEDCRTEFEITRNRTPAPAVSCRQQSQARLTSTPVTRYSSTPPRPQLQGKSNWEQYREIFEAIVCSNGWDDVTAALQLLAHLDGDALNVALLVPESQWAVPKFLINSLSDHYNSLDAGRSSSVSFRGWYVDRRMILQCLL